MLPPFDLLKTPLPILSRNSDQGRRRKQGLPDPQAALFTERPPSNPGGASKRMCVGFEFQLIISFRGRICGDFLRKAPCKKAKRFEFSGKNKDRKNQS